MAKSTVKTLQREIFWVSFIIGLIPTVMMSAAAGVIFTTPPQFLPNAEQAIYKAAFWLTQIVLLSSAVSVGALTNYIRIGKKKALNQPYLGLKHVLIWIFVFILSLTNFVYLLIGLPANFWLGFMAFLGIITMLLAYRVDMDLALIEATV